jgi:DNA-binding MarR family transcriptional regulator
MRHDYQILSQFRHGLSRFLRFSEQTCQGFGCTPALYELMLAIAVQPGGRAPDIGVAAATLGLRHHSAAELVKRAENAGFVERRRDPGDARRVLLVLTDAGKGILDDLVKHHVEELARTYERTFGVLEHLRRPNVSEPATMGRAQA